MLSVLLDMTEMCLSLTFGGPAEYGDVSCLGKDNCPVYLSTA